MIMADYSTVHLQGCLDRLRAGEAAARNELINCACDRLQRLTRKMLNDYRGVRRWEETGDVFQNAMLRLCRALQDLAPPSLRDFYRLAALQVRRELIDLARHYYGPQGVGANHASQGPAGASTGAPPAYEAADGSLDPGRVALWTEFHRQVGALPDEEREVFDLLWYQGLSQAEAATLVGVSDRTIKSRWRSARLKLSEALGGELPLGERH
jgi:RNA polymerase sigma-70 factor (ECF subfamily)